jgi:Domain of unknown function (DUF6754)
MTVLGLVLVVLAAALLMGLSRAKRLGRPRFRVVPALARLYRAVGLSVEDGTRLLIGLGGASLLTRNGGSALAGLGLLHDVARETSVSDRPPVAVAGEASLALLAQDALQAGFRAAGAPEFFQPTSGRLAGMTPFSSAAATIPMLTDEHVSAAGLIGHFGVEAALMSDAAERAGIALTGAADDPAAQAALFASASEALIGEEIFAASAYVGGRPAHVASLVVQDVLRWLIILGIVCAAGLKVLGLI